MKKITNRKEKREEKKKITKDEPGEDLG